MAVRTLSSGTKTIPYMPMTIQAIPCPAPVLENDFDSCRIPGGLNLWWDGGFYSPGECFVGYRAMCTQTVASSGGWPIVKGETAVRCIPVGYECNDQNEDQRYAVSDFDGTILSAPAFEIRWRSEDLKTGTDRLRPGAPTLGPISSGPPRPVSGALLPHTPTLLDSSAAPIIRPATSSSSRSSRAGSTDNSSSSFVPSGTIAGIVVGSCLGVMAIVSFVTFWLIQHRRKRQLECPTRLEEDPWDNTCTQEPGSVRILTHIPVELEDKPTEPRELSTETETKPQPQSQSQPQPQSQSQSQPWDSNFHQGANDVFVLKIPHISVNSSPAEVAADFDSGTDKRPSGEAGSPMSTTSEGDGGGGKKGPNARTSSQGS